MEKETVLFQGHIYTRYPESLRWHTRCYYNPGLMDKLTLGLEVLHREVWKFYRGPIPPGNHIHHRDFNPLNNDIDNLECLTPKQHGERHRYQPSAELLQHLGLIRPKAAEWHRSEEGRRWHKAHGERTWAQRQPVAKLCAECGKGFETRQDRDNVRFCSRRCFFRDWYRLPENRRQGTCQFCGGAFDVPKDRRPRCCSRTCANRLRAQQQAQPMR